MLFKAHEGTVVKPQGSLLIYPQELWYWLRNTYLIDQIYWKRLIETM